jgi:hypothetical protein
MAQYFDAVEWLFDNENVKLSLLEVKINFFAIYRGLS